LQGGPGIEVLTDVMSDGDDIPAGHEHERHKNPVSTEEVVARITQFKPRIIFVNLDLSIERECALLEALHRTCPETLVLLLTDKSVQEEQVIQALANGARGCLSHEADPFYFLKAVRVVDRGEIWVTRGMLGKIMDRVLH
jgi:DNA-binding NarL/FixJ family response regulator